jgi:hypothetical protein
MVELRAKLNEAAKSGDPKAVLGVIDAAIAEDPDVETMLAFGKYRILAGKDSDPDKAHEYGKRLVEKLFKDNPGALYQIAGVTLAGEDNGKPKTKLVSLALAAALRADELSKGKEPQIVAMLAKAHFLTGDAAKAVECQERALRLAKGTPREGEMQKSLDEYKKALEKSAGEKR